LAPKIPDVFRVQTCLQDNSGTLTAQEIKLALEKQGFSIPDQGWQQIVDLFDHDNSGEVNYAEFIAALQTTKAGLPVQQRQHFRHSSPSKVPSIPCPSDAEIIGVQGYKRPIRQARAVSEHMATLLDEPPETADSRFLEWAQYKCIANIAPVLVADPLKEQLKNLATTYGCSCNE